MRRERKAPTLSIVIPCYNVEKYVEQAIKNIEKQTFTDWEAIFVDDGSTDETGNILDKLLLGKEKYKIIHKKNGGSASARNSGMNIAIGKYITFLDADDELVNDIYEKLINLINNTCADMSVCGYYLKLEDENSKTSYLEEKSYPTVLYKSRTEIREHLVDMWDSEVISYVWNKVYRMNLIKEKNIKFRDGHVYTEDRVFNRLFIENCNSIAITEDCLYYYVRERKGSITEKYRDDYFEIRHKEYKEFQEHFRNMNVWNEKAKEYVCREFIERISGCFENLFHAEKLSKKDKKDVINEIINHEDVYESIKYAKCRSKKMKFLIYPIKNKNNEITYLIYKLIYQIRKKYPTIFYKLKSKR